MKKTFWIVLILLFLLVNEYLSKFLLAIFVGRLELLDAYERTFQYPSIDSYLFSASFRAIPFLALSIFAAKSKASSSRAGRIMIWGLAFFIASFVFYGYWGMQHSLFTDEHTSSTSALAIIWIPIWALLISVIGCVFLFGTSKIFRLFQKQT
jgi:quinol-cytochrome oxidoreductase complex cytochrome b subunit